MNRTPQSIGNGGGERNGPGPLGGDARERARGARAAQTRSTVPP